MKVRNIYRTVSEALRTSKGRNILTFLVFLAISAVFWLLLALNDDVQQDYNIPVQLEGFPEDVTLLSGYNTTLSVAVKDKGSSLMKYEFGNNPTMKLNFDDFINTGDTVLTIRASQLNSAVRSIFGNGVELLIGQLFTSLVALCNLGIIARDLRATLLKHILDELFSHNVLQKLGT